MSETNGSRPVYVILGAAGGIGSRLARRLASRSAHLILAGRTAATLEELASETGAETAVIDARSFDEVENCVAQAKDRFGRLDGVVNCVGSILLKPAHRTSRDEFDDVVATNLASAFAAVRASARELEEGGSIVLVSTTAAQTGLANHEAIAAAKAGVIGLARSAAATYASRKVRVNCVAPGLIDTPLSSRITGNKASLEASIRMHPLGRIGDPDDVASAIDWLLGRESGWVTGQVLGVDGGLASLRPR
jgi:NAD(P)-dependent dehydrogenase (short-subunit alcohol dehydrogenase family)